MDNTPDMYLDEIYTYQKCAPIVVNKQLLIYYTAAILWDNIPTRLISFSFLFS